MNEKIVIWLNFMVTASSTSLVSRGQLIWSFLYLLICRSDSEVSSLWLVLFK